MIIVIKTLMIRRLEVVELDKNQYSAQKKCEELLPDKNQKKIDK